MFTICAGRWLVLATTPIIAKLLELSRTTVLQPGSYICELFEENSSSAANVTGFILQQTKQQIS